MCGGEEVTVIIDPQVISEVPAAAVLVVPPRTTTVSTEPTTSILA